MKRKRLLVSFAAAAALVAAGATAARADLRFIRGDANGDGEINIGDAICALTHLFNASSGGPCAQPGCEASHDANDDGVLNIADPITVLSHLFAKGLPLAAPFPDCGYDPSPDSLTCLEQPPPCDSSPESIVLSVASGLSLSLIWSEGYDTVEAVTERLSVAALRPGSYEVSLRRDTEGSDLIESLLFGPALDPAAPLDRGAFRVKTGEPRRCEYRQRFTTPLGIWTFVMELYVIQPPAGDGAGEPESDPPSFTVDCELLDGVMGSVLEVSFRAELDRDGVLRNLHYSCFLPDSWSPARRMSPLSVTLEDGTVLGLWLEDAWLFRGVAGETSNRRLARAGVQFRSVTRTVAEYRRLIYAGLHHNWNQEFRVLFEEPIEGVHGMDLVECPGPDCMSTQGPVEGQSKAFLLDADLERVAELAVTKVSFSP